MQVARFIGAIVVHPMWVNGGIVTTALSLAGMQAATLVFAVALWRRTSRAKHVPDVQLITPRVFMTVEGETEPAGKPAEAHDNVEERKGVIAV